MTHQHDHDSLTDLGRLGVGKFFKALVEGDRNSQNKLGKIEVMSPCNMSPLQLREAACELME